MNAVVSVAMSKAMKGWRHAGRTLISAIALLLFVPSSALGGDAVPLPPEDLVVSNGGDAWRPDDGFDLRWRNPEPVEGGAALVAVHYRVRNPAGTAVVGETRINWLVSHIHRVLVPSIPAAYTAEVWLEDAGGNEGAPAAVKLRFDDVRPADVEPLPKPGWVSRTDQPYTLPISHPDEPLPLSGVRGYAISIDRSPNGDPCLLADRCSDAETDLRGGVEEDSIALSELPEGKSYVHAVAVSGSGMKSNLPGHAMLRVDRTDPTTVLDGVPDDWTNHSVLLTATAIDARSGMKATAEGESPFTAIRVDGGVPAIAAGDSVSAAVIEPGVHAVSYYARDAAGNLNDGAHNNGNDNNPPSTTLVRIDRDLPGVAFLNLLNPADPELIRARVTDHLAGPDLARGSIAVRPHGSDDRFEPLPTEAGEVLRARWDSDAYLPGLYEFRAVGYDAAGNSSATYERASGTPMVLSNPLKAPTALQAGFAVRPPRSRGCGRRNGARACRRHPGAFSSQSTPLRVPFGHGARFAGRLVASGTPLSGVRVLVVERFPAALSSQDRVATVTTGADGTFAAVLEPGPSREVTAVFPGSPTLGRSRSGPLRLEGASGVRLSASSSVAAVGGPPVVFRGRLARGAVPIALGERTVQLQFRVPGLPWTEFRSLQTDARGRFKFPYTFHDDDSRGVSFRFRAFVPAQIGWPYGPAGSPPVTVRGR